MSADDAGGFGGIIPPGVLDPTICSLLPAPRGRFDVLASTRGALADATRRFLALQHRRHIAPLHSLHYDGLAGTRMHDRFTPDYDPGETVRMVDLDELEQRAEAQFFLQEPTLKEQSMETEEAVKQCTPQYFLRNVLRLQRTPGLPVPPYQIEIYADTDYLERIGTHDFVTGFEFPEVDSGEARRMVAAWWDERAQLLFRNDWEEIHGNKAWRNYAEEVPIISLVATTELKRVRGRFANAAEAEAEAKTAKITKATQSMDADDFFRLMRAGKLPK